MSRLKITMFCVLSAITMLDVVPRACASIIPVYNTHIPHSEHHFPHHSKHRTNYPSEPIFHSIEHNTPVSYKPNPIPIVLEPISSVYKPKSAPVYKPKPSQKVIFHSSPYKHDIIHEAKHNEVHHEIKPHKKHLHEPKYSIKPIHYDKKKAKPYAFDYGVQDSYSGANFGHTETSDGNEVKGSYTVALPDGRIQKVTYTADHHNGFQAKVTYEGEAKYPKYVPKPQVFLHPRPQEYKIRPKTEYDDSHEIEPHYETISIHDQPPLHHHQIHHDLPSYNLVSVPRVYTLPHH